MSTQCVLVSKNCVSVEFQVSSRRIFFADEWPSLFLSRMWSVLQIGTQLEGAQAKSVHGWVVQVQHACCVEDASGSPRRCKQRQLQHSQVGLAGVVPGCSPPEETKTMGSLLQRRSNCNVLEATGCPRIRSRSRRFLQAGDNSTTRCRRHKPTFLQKTAGGSVSAAAWKTLHLAATNKCPFHPVVPTLTAHSQACVPESPSWLRCSQREETHFRLRVRLPRLRPPVVSVHVSFPWLNKICSKQVTHN